MSSDMRSALLRETEFLIRTRGYSAFSYADLAERASIAKASVHHYFPTKEDLVLVLVKEYVGRFVETLASVERVNSRAPDRLRAYARLFLDGFDSGMLPLCGALAAERSALPESMRSRVQDFFQLHLDWLSRVVREGVDAGDLRAVSPPDRAALLLLSALEGGSLVGWALARSAPVVSAFEDVLLSLEYGPNPVRAATMCLARDSPKGGYAFQKKGPSADLARAPATKLPTSKE
jgi:TetR/AcrR family transcriptional repressor of nem operon